MRRRLLPSAGTTTWTLAVVAALAAAVVLGGTYAAGATGSAAGAPVNSATPPVPPPVDPSLSPEPVIDLCTLLDGEGTCILSPGEPDGSVGPIGPGDEQMPLPDPTTCPYPDPAPPESLPAAIADGFLDCLDQPTPTPSATFVVAGGDNRLAQDDKKKVVTVSFYLGDKGRRGYSKAFLLLSASDDVQEYTGVFVAELKAKVGDGTVTKTVRFTTFKKGKFKDPISGKEISGFLAERAMDPALRPVVGSEVECEVKAIIGAVLLKDENVDRPLKFEGVDKFKIKVSE